MQRRRRDGGNEAEAKRRRRAADGSPPLMRLFELPLVTRAGFAKRNGHGRAGKRADRKPVHRSKERVGHGGFTLLVPKTNFEKIPVGGETIGREKHSPTRVVR